MRLPLPDGASDVIVYPGTLSGPRAAGVKLSPYLAARPAGERVTAWTLLLDRGRAAAAPVRQRPVDRRTHRGHDRGAGAAVAAGELRPLIEAGRVEVLADLPELVTGTAPPRLPGRAFFRSVGLGIEDLAVAALLLDPGTEPA